MMIMICGESRAGVAFDNALIELPRKGETRTTLTEAVRKHQMKKSFFPAQINVKSKKCVSRDDMNYVK